MDRRLAKTEADIAELKDIGNIGIGNTSTLATLNNGRLTFAAAQMGAEVIPGLLESIRKATSESVTYPTGKATATTKGASTRR